MASEHGNGANPGPGGTSGPSSNIHTTALERELAQLERINSTISRLISTIRTTHTNIDSMNESSNNTHILLDQWIRILSQTNFTHEIINDGWNGETADVEGLAELEKSLLEELASLEDENGALRRKIDEKEKERQETESKQEEIATRRRRELGLLRTTKRPRI
ncbi:uncharacterized protein CANTADRAFT_21778 [Suhomyces tanzawaensis NRRL Y-17324]|uniref:DASH complex subunit DUO1 n=1 Tax=Suhomyces tanzawaensis NRRL Y-17324 TaxID=984487 RepID=A0A1E4SHM8_9ASCO|nr:uncharacterized protein CANTADRAFT_21778 [Suhomyces tanzawaensis NRRL Y-17324]ODV78996.1 hypothetical protein CANTADRAFT_21778 [Suhomyces tanzawaensis NRRL Y-17324]